MLCVFSHISLPQHVFLPPSSRPDLDIRCTTAPLQRSTFFSLPPRPVDIWSLVPTRVASRCDMFPPCPLCHSLPNARFCCIHIALFILSVTTLARLFGAVADIEISSPSIREVRSFYLSEVMFTCVNGVMRQGVYGAWCRVFDVAQSDMDRPLNSYVTPPSSFPSSTIASVIFVCRVTASKQFVLILRARTGFPPSVNFSSVL